MRKRFAVEHGGSCGIHQEAESGARHCNFCHWETVTAIKMNLLGKRRVSHGKEQQREEAAYETAKHIPKHRTLAEHHRQYCIKTNVRAIIFELKFLQRCRLKTPPIRKLAQARAFVRAKAFCVLLWTWRQS